MPISFELGGYLRQHLTYLAEHGFTDPENYLISGRKQLARNSKMQFIGGTGALDATKPLYAPHVVVQRIMARAGYPVLKEGEHTLRRSGARAYFDQLVENGYDGALKRVQSMLGHRNASSTERYIGLNPERLARNRDLRGKPMFPVQDAKVIPIRKEK
jgi:site-specific recombinase XerD